MGSAKSVACPLCLFDGRGYWFRRHLSCVDLLGMMEATAQRQGGGDGGESKDGAHDLIPLLVLSLKFGTRDFAHLAAIRLEKR